MRINRFVATATLLSRRAADAAIASGRVSINGTVAALGRQVLAHDVVTLDGNVITPPEVFTYVLLHKPVGYVVSRKPQGNAPTIYELLPARLSHLKPAGRLDKDSSGVMLLSNDGEFLQQAAHPSADKEKHYEVVLDRVATASDLLPLQNGVWLSDGLSRPQLLAHNGQRLTMSLHEGRNRQIRRTMQALGFRVTHLHRRAFGRLTLSGLKPGQWRELPEAPQL